MRDGWSVPQAEVCECQLSGGEYWGAALNFCDAVLYLPIFLVAVITAVLVNNLFAFNLGVALLGLSLCLVLALLVRRNGLKL
jgi:hypothetical protein